MGMSKDARKGDSRGMGYDKELKLMLIIIPIVKSFIKFKQQRSFYKMN